MLAELRSTDGLEQGRAFGTDGLEQGRAFGTDRLEQGRPLGTDGLEQGRAERAVPTRNEYFGFHLSVI